MVNIRFTFIKKLSAYFSQIIPVPENSVDPEQLASEKASKSEVLLFSRHMMHPIHVSDDISPLHWLDIRTCFTDRSV